jgi:hypothetical protein
MTGVLIVVLIIGALFVLRMLTSMFSQGVEKGIYHAGGALGRTLADRAAARQPPTGTGAHQWVVTSTRPGVRIREELRSRGMLRDDNHVETAAGVSVELSLTRGVAELACRWEPFAGEKGTQIIGDVLRIVRQVDPGAQVVV